MSEYANTFDKEFLSRTKYIIENYKGEYEVTLLINCTLALICLPIEHIKNEDNPNLEIVEKVADKLKEILKIKKDNDLALIKSLRNGIAHLKIQTIGYENELKSIKITGETKIDTENYCKTFIFDILKLREFALSIADIFLKYSE